MTDANAAAEHILRLRSRELARPPLQPPAADSMLELLEFRLASERYGLETRHVEEVQPLRDLTPVPGTPAFVLGVVNVRGRIVPVLDLRKFFDLPDKGLTDLHRVILIRGDDLEFGLLADVVVGVHSLAVTSLQASLPTLTGIRADFLKGVSDQRLVVLDVERMMADPKIVVHQEAGE